MNKVDFTSERYLTAENDTMETIQTEMNNVVNEEADSTTLEWLNFRQNHLGKKCVFDKENGNMFTVD